MIIDIGTAGGLDASQSLEGKCLGELVQCGCPGKNPIKNLGLCAFPRTVHCTWLWVLMWYQWRRGSQLHELSELCKETAGTFVTVGWVLLVFSNRELNILLMNTFSVIVIVNSFFDILYQISIL